MTYRDAAIFIQMRRMGRNGVMKTILFISVLFGANAYPDAPSDAEVLEYVVSFNRAYAEDNVDIYLEHVPESGFWIKYPDLRRELNMTPKVIRGIWAKAKDNIIGWPPVISVQQIDKTKHHVDVTLAVVRIVQEEDKQTLHYFVKLDRLVSSNGKAMVIQEVIQKHWPRTLESANGKRAPK